MHIADIRLVTPINQHKPVLVVTCLLTPPIGAPPILSLSRLGPIGYQRRPWSVPAPCSCSLSLSLSLSRSCAQLRVAVREVATLAVLATASREVLAPERERERETNESERETLRVQSCWEAFSGTGRPQASTGSCSLKSFPRGP